MVEDGVVMETRSFVVDGVVVGVVVVVVGARVVVRVIVVVMVVRTSPLVIKLLLLELLL